MKVLNVGYFLKRYPDIKKTVAYEMNKYNKIVSEISAYD